MSIIGNAIMLGGGGGTKTVTLKGVPQSTISWTGADTGSVNTGNSGDASVALIPGTYTFVNTVVIDGTTYTAYTKTAAINADAVVQLFPDNVIYWYGRTAVAIDNPAGYSGHGVSLKAMTAKTNCVSETESTGYQQNKGVIWGTATAIDTTGFTELKFVQYLSWANNRGYLFGAIGLFANKSDANPVYSFAEAGSGQGTGVVRDGTTVDHVTILNPGQYYLSGYAFRGYNNQGSVTMKVFAVWLE